MSQEQFFVDSFFEMERKFKLFTLRDKYGVPIWDILRFDIYLYYTFNEGNLNIKHKKTAFSKKMLILLVGLPKVVLSFFHTLFIKADVLIFEHPRYKANGSTIDFATENIYKIEKEKKIAIAKYKALDKHSHYIEYDFCDLFIKHLHKKELVDNNIKSYIYKAIDSLNIEPLPVNFIDDVYNTFQAETKFYSWLFKTKKNKRVILNRDGIKKGLLYAAKNLGIKVYEVQHGMFSKNHLAYSYPNIVEKYSEDIIVPNILFTFDIMWGKGINVPFNCIPIGNSYFALDKEYKQKINNNIYRESILIISSKVHAAYMRDITLKLIKQHSDISIVYKLHPNEYANYEDYISIFKAYKNIRVVANELSIKELLVNTKLVVLINSTILYEALEYGINVAVYKQMNYDSYIEYIEQGIVGAFNNEDDLYSIYKECHRIKSLSFFKEFDCNMYYKSIC